MSALTIYNEEANSTPETITDVDQISARLAQEGVQFEQWQADRVLAPDASAEEVMAAYQDSIASLNEKYGFRSMDVVSIGPDHPDRVAMRAKFLAEHTHDDFEVRFFVDGSGLFYLHVGPQVFMVFCERGDLISVPAGVPHWFDMGEHPNFKCIRFFTAPEGWVGNFTGSEIAKVFPDFDAHLSALS